MRIPTIPILVFFVSFTHFSKAQETIHSVAHNEFSFAVIYSTVELEDNHSFVSPTLEIGRQLRYTRYFPIARYYGIGTGFFLAVQKFCFEFDLEKLGHLFYDHPVVWKLPTTIATKHTSVSVLTAGVPVYLSGAFPLSKTWLINAKIGGNINFLVPVDNETQVFDSDSDSTVLSAHYRFDSTPQVGFLFEVGPEYTFRNGRTFSLSLISTTNFVDRTKVDYTLYPERPEDSISGTVRATGSYFGLSLGFIY